MALNIPDNVIELLRMMVGVNTINAALPGAVCDETGGENKLVEMLAELAEAWGLTARRLQVCGQSDQLLVTVEVDAGLPWVLFDSHLDTVAVEGMTIDPFGAVLRDGKVWGRGACDTKGTGAAMLWAMKDIAADADRAALPNNLALLFSVEEEVSMRGIQSFVAVDLPTLGWTPAAVIVGEPTELRAVIAHNGCLRWTITTHGKACHSSTPHDGVSAISAMVRVIDVIEQRYIPSLTAEHALTGPAVCSINLIRGGSAPNIIPDACEIEIDRRVVPGEDAAQVLGTIHGLLEPMKHSEPPLSFTQDVSIDHPPLTTQHNGPLVEHLNNILETMNLSTLALGAPFATHAAYFDAAGLPAVVLGPGSPHTAHKKDEWVAIDQVERGVGVYRQIMLTPLATANR